ncbi:YtxH domain-containing protein [Aerococcaceae bacterium WGS1372]
MAGFKNGLFWGAVFGGLAGLMNAPQSGKETRENLKNFIENTTDDVNDVRYKVDNLRMAVQRLSQEGLGSVQQASEEIQTTLKHFEEETKPRMNRIQDRADTLAKNIETHTKELTLNDKEI